LRASAYFARVAIAPAAFRYDFLIRRAAFHRLTELAGFLSPLTLPGDTPPCAFATFSVSYATFVTVIAHDASPTDVSASPIRWPGCHSFACHALRLIFFADISLFHAAGLFRCQPPRLCYCFRASAVDIIDILSDAFDAYAALYKIFEFTRAPLLPRDFLFAGWLAMLFR
jgi:hypothetical protein